MGSNNRMDPVVEELLQGQNYANQLHYLLQSHHPNLSVSANKLAHNILSSFTTCLSLLSSSSPTSEFSPDLPTSQTAGDKKSGRFGEISNRQNISKDRRGCYKRKKNSQSWTVVSSTITDEYSWRKYGQKDILNAMYPRNYFRCTRKYDQGCKAVKQVQKMENDPEKFHILYIGQHTCKDISSSSQILGDSSDWGSCHRNDDNHPVSTPAIKQEESSTPSDLTDNVSNTLSSMAWKEFMTVDAVLSSTEVTSQDMDFFSIKPFDFEEDFHFD